MTISSTSSTRLSVSRGSQSIMEPRCPGRGVTCRWSFAPTAECYLIMLLLAAPTSEGTWDLHLHVEPVGSSEWKLPRSSKVILANAKRHWLQKQQLNSQPPRAKLVRRRRHSWRHPPPSPHHSPMEASGCLSIFVCSNKGLGSRTSMLNNRGAKASVPNN